MVFKDGIMKQTIVVIVEHFAGQIKPVSHELVSCAKRLQQKKASAIKAVILDADPAALAREMADTWGLEVTAVRIPELATYVGEIYKSVLADLLPEFEAAYVCIAHSSQGMDFAPALSVELNAACITGVEDIIEVENRTCFARSIFGAKAVAYIRPQSDISILTIQPGRFKPQKPDKPVSGSVIDRSFTCESLKTRSRGIKQTETDMTGITEAGVIVSAGQGLGDKENLDLIYQLAALFTKSAVAGSRIVCDSGWLEYRCQVGVTGATVSPRLYIACGISGAVQHIMGMCNSEYIVAINKDPAAAIFQFADICIVEDLTTFIPAFIEVYEKTKSKGGHNG
jgi:electron transfer flavoprotein alpha subunit